MYIKDSARQQQLVVTFYVELVHEQDSQIPPELEHVIEPNRQALKAMNVGMSCVCFSA